MNETAFSIKYFGGFLTALICNAFFTIAPLAVLCFVLVIIDCITSWRLSCRLRAQGKSSGKFRSDKFGRAVIEMSIVIPVALLIAHFVQLYIFEGSNFHLPQITAGVICFWQIWSILENMSSGGREAVWAKALQKIMIDKAERHLDIDLTEFKQNNDEKANERDTI
jgi:hypothetical protein